MVEESFEAFDDLVVSFAVGFSGISEDVDEGEETVEAEEDEDGIGVIIGHHAWNDGGNQGRSSKCKPMSYIGDNCLTCGYNFGRVGPDRWDEWSTIDSHVDAHYKHRW